MDEVTSTFYQRLVSSTPLSSIQPSWSGCCLFSSVRDLTRSWRSEKPKFVFDGEAHLLFNDAKQALPGKVEQVVRLIRSKGVGIYFITQNLQDLPESVLAQLGIVSNMPCVPIRQRKWRPSAGRKVFQSFRPNPEFDTETVLTFWELNREARLLLNEKGNQVWNVLIFCLHNRVLIC